MDYRLSVHMLNTNRASDHSHALPRIPSTASTMAPWRLTEIPWWWMVRRLLCPTLATQQRSPSVSTARNMCVNPQAGIMRKPPCSTTSLFRGQNHWHMIDRHSKVVILFFDFLNMYIIGPCGSNDHVWLLFYAEVPLNLKLFLFDCFPHSSHFPCCSRSPWFPDKSFPT